MTRAHFSRPPITSRLPFSAGLVTKPAGPNANGHMGPLMKQQGKGTETLSIFLSSVAYLWAHPGAFIFYLMPLSPGHRDTRGGRADPARCRQSGVRVHSPPPPAADFPAPPHSKQRHRAGGGAGKPTTQPAADLWPQGPRAFLSLHRHALGARKGWALPAQGDTRCPAPIDRRRRGAPGDPDPPAPTPSPPGSRARPRAPGGGGAGAGDPAAWNPLPLPGGRGRTPPERSLRAWSWQRGPLGIHFQKQKFKRQN